MSPEQYRARYGEDPRPPEFRTTAWPDATGWPGWTSPCSPPNVVLVMADWTDWCLWDRSPAGEPPWQCSDMEPETLGVSPRLTERLRSWNDRYEVDAAKSAWIEEGWTLAHDLQREFDSRGIDAEVRYRDGDGEERPVRGSRRRSTRR